MEIFSSIRSPQSKHILRLNESIAITNSIIFNSTIAHEIVINIDSGNKATQLTTTANTIACSTTRNNFPLSFVSINIWGCNWRPRTCECVCDHATIPSNMFLPPFQFIPMMINNKYYQDIVSRQYLVIIWSKRSESFTHTRAHTHEQIAVAN